MIGESLRHCAFTVFDRLKGGRIKSHLNDLRLAFENIPQGQQLAAQRRSQILKHATETALFYKPYSGCSDINDFPVIQKKIIKDNYDAFLSSSFKRSRLIKTTTSGSYGTPFTFLLSREKRARQQAEVIFFNSWAGYRVGMKYAQVRVHPRSKWLLWAQNGYLINPSVVEEDWLQANRKLLKEKKSQFIIGYPCAIHPLAEYCKLMGDGPKEFFLEGIISGAEPLLESTRYLFEEVFGCAVLDRYSSNELGVISHECAACKNHHVNYISHYVEILKLDSDEPAEPGQLGRIVVTDFFSHAMPLIRYDTGDTSSWAKERCSCGLDVPIFEKIGGRLVETIYDPSGKIINALAIDRDPKDLAGIVQFQFIQKTNDTYLMKLHVTENFKDEPLLRQRLMKMLGPDANLSFDYVDSIPPLPSGKRPYIINEYKKKE